METTHPHLLDKLYESIDNHVPDQDNEEEPLDIPSDLILTNFESRLAIVQDFEPDFPYSFPRSQVDEGAMTQALERYSQGFFEMHDLLGEMEEASNRIFISDDEGIGEEEELPIEQEDPATDDDYSTQASFSSPMADIEDISSPSRFDRRSMNASSSPLSESHSFSKHQEKQRARFSSSRDRARDSPSPSSAALLRRKGKERARDSPSPEFSSEFSSIAGKKRE